jgi:uncharacterized protein YodC (DUF2158 family)
MASKAPQTMRPVKAEAIVRANLVENQERARSRDTLAPTRSPFRRAEQERDVANEQFKEGGPAFPVPENNDGMGMSLRDWFAGQAVRALVKDADIGGPADTQRLARKAYWVADELIAARLLDRDNLRAP